ncbi:MAG: 16S rRNA (adenine(1518)-N(6)/adenine(1519)-N(6))-dimethyltransferase RsmA [Bacillota bacterium]
MSYLTSPSAVRKLLESYNFRCRKSMGQNFLVDANIVNKIISSALLDEDDTVVEIGPGLGVITRAAAMKAKGVVALELDRGLLPILEDTLKDLSNVSIVAGDAMEADLDAVVSSARAGYSGPYKLIANLPYYITTPLIMRLLTGGFNISLCVIMVQQEVAERIAALPGGKEYGALSVAVQYYTEARCLFRVPATVFYPRPEVDSAVVRLLRRPKPAVGVPDEDLFFKVVRGSFGQRRKTLLNALGKVFNNIPREKLGKLLQAAGIDPGRRGETLSLTEFARITREIYNLEL